MKYDFIGYPHMVKGYKIWNMDPGRSKFFIRMDDTFMRPLWRWISNIRMLNNKKLW